MKAKYNGTWYNDVYQYSNGCILIKELGKAFDPDELECIIHGERPVHKNKSEGHLMCMKTCVAQKKKQKGLLYLLAEKHMFWLLINRI